MRSEHYESEWVVVTYDGLFLGWNGEVTQEYPNAKLFPRRGLAVHAAQQTKNLGPYNVMTTGQYAEGAA